MLYHRIKSFNMLTLDELPVMNTTTRAGILPCLCKRLKYSRSACISHRGGGGGKREEGGGEEGGEEEARERTSSYV